MVSRHSPVQITVRLAAAGLFSILVCGAGCAGDSPNAEAVTRAAIAAQEASKPAPPEPEQVAREFMLAMAKGDREAMAKRMIPNPDANLIAEMRRPADERELTELFRSLPITRLKPGDALPDPFTPGQPVTSEMIDADHLILSMHTLGKDAWTFFLVRGADGWRLNMDWFIEALKRSRAAPRTSVR